MDTLIAKNPDIWHYLLAAELPYAKLKKIVQDLSSEGSLASLTNLISHDALTDAERRRIQSVDIHYVHKIMRQGAELTPPVDFPEGLSQMESPPPYLYLWGSKCWKNRKNLAIVGTRKVSSYGAKCTKWFASYLAERDFNIISGGAYGVDTVAHESSLEHGATTVIFATGIDASHPVSNANLYSKIKDSGGCLISSFGIGTKWHQSRPLIRNYLIAAMADAVLLIEAPSKSGALVTANAALQMGKDVYVVPGNIDSSNYGGSNAFIRDGATLVYHPEQVYEDMSGVLSGVKKRGNEGISVSTLEIANESHREVYNVLLNGGMRMDELSSRFSRYSVPQLMCLLTEMELEGYIHREGDKYLVTLN